MSISLVRLLIGDRNKVAVNEIVGEGDNTNRYFQLDMYPVASTPTAILTLFLTGVTAATNTYIISGGVGRVTFNVGSTPAAGATILANYKYVALTDSEIIDILSGHTGEPYLAAANAALVLAADSSRLFMYTMGDKTVDKRRIASNLIELSQELEKRHYNILDRSNYTGTVFTHTDDTGTPYYSYDTAVANLEETS